MIGVESTPMIAHGRGQVQYQENISIVSVIDSGSDFEGLKDSHFVIAVC